jgi:hypothetical protein
MGAGGALQYNVGVMPVAGETESALITNEQPERVKLLAQVVAGLGYEVIARDVEAVAAVTAQEHPDVVLGGVGRSRPRFCAAATWQCATAKTATGPP